MGTIMNPDRLQELLDSPLEHSPTRRRWLPAVIAFVSVGIAVTAVAVVTNSGEPESRTSATTGFDAAATTSVPPSTSATSPPTTLPPTLVPADPAPVNFPAMTSDGTRAVMIGGAVRVDVQAGTYLLDLDGRAWLGPDKGDLEDPLVAAASAYDAESGTVVVFGGSARPLRFCSPTQFCSERRYDSTRLFDPTSLRWESITVPDGPMGRIGHAMVYDTNSDRIVLFGGAITAGNDWNGLPLSDTWIFDTNTRRWTKGSPVEAPPARAFHAMAYHPALDRVVMWGGAVEGDDDATVWLYDVDEDAWSSLTVADAPPSRWQHSMGHDPARGEILVFGGIYEQTRDLGSGITATGIDPTNELWALDIEGGRWEQRRPAPELIYSGGAVHVDERSNFVVWSFGHTMVYDPINDSWTDLTGLLTPAG